MIPFKLLSKSLVLSALCMSVPAAPSLAETAVYLIYPESWCGSAEVEPLHFTFPQLGVGPVATIDGPSHGRIYIHPDSDRGGYYLPACDGLTVLGFDYFHVTGSNGELIHGTILLGNGLPEEVRAEENAAGGVLGQEWSLQSPGSGLEIVEWTGGAILEGTHGFRVASGQIEDAYLMFGFSGGLNMFQPPDHEGGGNNGVETEITLRPPTLPPPNSGYEAILESVIYATGRFDGTAPESLLRLRAQHGLWEIRAEAAAVGGVFGMSQGFETTIATEWCPLVANQANEIVLRRLHGLDGNQDLMTLSVTSAAEGNCSDTQQGFISARTQGPEHRFGTLDVLGGPGFDFDEVSVETMRHEPDLASIMLDGFETSQTWSPAWQAVRPDLLSVESGAANTGSFGLRVQPEPASPAYLHRALTEPVSELACRFSLDADFSARVGEPKIRIFTARSSQGREIKFWVRRSSGRYQLQAISGTQASPWVPVSRFPATLDFRWSAGVLDFWLQSCEVGGSNCESGHRTGVPSPRLITDFQLGAETTSQSVSGGVSFDNMQCLVPK